MKQLTLNFMAAVSAPRYNVAITGEKSADGLGWVWQCNVFAHYTLVSIQMACSLAYGLTECH